MARQSSDGGGEIEIFEYPAVPWSSPNACLGRLGGDGG